MRWHISECAFWSGGLVDYTEAPRALVRRSTSASRYPRGELSSNARLISTPPVYTYGHIHAQGGRTANLRLAFAQNGIHTSHS